MVDTYVKTRLKINLFPGTLHTTSRSISPRLLSENVLFSSPHFLNLFVLRSLQETDGFFRWFFLGCRMTSKRLHGNGVVASDSLAAELIFLQRLRQI